MRKSLYFLPDLFSPVREWYVSFAMLLQLPLSWETSSFPKWPPLACNTYAVSKREDDAREDPIQYILLIPSQHCLFTKHIEGKCHSCNTCKQVSYSMWGMHRWPPFSMWGMQLRRLPPLIGEPEGRPSRHKTVSHDKILLPIYSFLQSTWFQLSLFLKRVH